MASEDFSEVGYRHSFGPHFRPWLPRPKNLIYTEEQPGQMARWTYNGPPLSETPIELTADDRPYVRFLNVTSRYRPGKEPHDMILGIYLNTHGEIPTRRTICQIPPGMTLQKNNIAPLEEQANDIFAIYSNSPAASPHHTPHGMARMISTSGNPKQIPVLIYMMLLGNVRNFRFNPDNTLSQLDEQGNLIKQYTEADFSETCKTYITRNFILNKRYDSTPSIHEIAPISFTISFAGAEFDLFSHSTIANRPPHWNNDEFIEHRVNTFLTQYGISVTDGVPTPTQLSYEQHVALEGLFTNFMRDGFDTHDIIQLLYFFQDVFNCQMVAMLDMTCSESIDNEEIFAKIFTAMTPTAIYGGKTKRKKNKKIKLHKSNRK